MAEYCEITELETDLRVGGAEYVNEGNPDFMAGAIVDAGFEIDAAICNQIEPAAARAQANGFLNMCCRALAAEECFKGDECPESFKLKAERIRGMLNRIEAGGKIPGFTYPSQPSGDPQYDITAGLPLTVNPCPGRRMW